MAKLSAICFLLLVLIVFTGGTYITLMSYWCQWQKQKTATRCGTVKAINVAGTIVKIVTMARGSVIYILHLAFLNNAFVPTSVDNHLKSSSTST
ncbi:uncharacterized protein LOC116143031 isoform X1 [Pistacia vera]|uniref:uncharacterized protein LOC116143031 isoform X1 n=1 Tax=Pistacia vera TaxID=55513 RepID=UPI001262C853|nr:uncharacterized protein LOC116143031 isoform X1 [Pistacia vera]